MTRGCAWPHQRRGAASVPGEEKQRALGWRCLAPKARGRSSSRFRVFHRAESWQCVLRPARRLRWSLSERSHSPGSFPNAGRTRPFRANGRQPTPQTQDLAGVQKRGAGRPVRRRVRGPQVSQLKGSNGCGGRFHTAAGAGPAGVAASTGVVSALSVISFRRNGMSARSARPTTRLPAPSSAKSFA
jgi:hypothetical protein